MNNSKRDILYAVRRIVRSVRDEEQQDLDSIPDNIENSNACDSFRANLIDLDVAMAKLDVVCGRTYNDR